MAKVRVLYATAFAAIGVETEGGAEVSIEDSQANDLVAAGYAELVKPKAEPAAAMPTRKATLTRKATK